MPGVLIAVPTMEVMMAAKEKTVKAIGLGIHRNGSKGFILDRSGLLGSI